MEPHSGTPRSTLQLIIDREFGLALAGKVVLVTAFWAQTMLFVVLTFDRTGSAALVGVITAAQVLPQLILAPLSGSLADRRGPRLPVVSGGACTGIGCIALAIWLELPVQMPVPSEVPLVVASVVCGVGVALSSAAIQTIPPRLVAPSELDAAVSLNFLPTAMARTLGPIAGAALASAVGSVSTLAIVGAACFVAASVFVPIRRLAARGNAHTAGGLRSAVCAVRTDKRLLAVLSAAALIGAGSEAAITLAPSIGGILGIGPSGAGWVTGAFGLGGLLGVVAYRVCSRFLRPAAAGCVAMILLGGSMAAIGMAPSLSLGTLMLVVAGASMVVGITGFSIVAQRLSPPESLGRVMALWVMAFTGFRPGAGLVLGFVSDHVSATAALIGAGLLTAISAGAVHSWVQDRRSRAARSPKRSGRGAREPSRTSAVRHPPQADIALVPGRAIDSSTEP